ncbi:hypothetical protein Q7P37_006479 [Cladosporium fusiforme]
MATPQPPMIKPQQIDSLPHLDASQKQTYKQGLMNLWNVYDSNPEGSSGRNEARAKIVSASQKIMQQLNRATRPNANAPPQQAQRTSMAGQGGQVPQGAVQGQQPQQQAVQQPTAQSQPQAQPQQQPPQQPQAQQQPQQPQQAQQPPQAQQQVGQPNEHAQLQAKVKQMVQNIVVFPEPTTANAQQFDAYKATFQQTLGNSILKRERTRAEIPRLEALETQMKSQGQNLTDEMQTRLNSARTVLAEASRQVTALEQKNEQNKNLYNQKQQRNKEQQQQQQGQQHPQQNVQQPNGQAMGNPQVNGAQAQAQAMQRTNSQQAQANLGQGDVKMEQRPSNSPSQPQFAQQQNQIQTPQAGTPVQQQQQMPPQQQQQPRPQQMVQPQGTPQSATQPQQQFPQNNMPQQQAQQQRPPMNQQQSQQQQQQQHPQYGVPQQQQASQQQQQQYQQQTPQSAMQQNAMPNQQQQPQRPQALTQRDAMAQAAQSYTQQQQNQQQNPAVNQPQQPMQQPHSNMPNGMPFNQPQSAQQQHTPTSSFPGNQQLNSAQTKFPIPKDLRMDPRTQTPVQGPPSRPTMMGQGGMMNVPGVQKPAHFTLEGEGDHVLSKRKLDELVRQITGSTAPQDGLSPEVEEAVLSLTDNFVDNVIQKACQLAKLRAGQTLDVKDVQMVLERNYGIRIPGYSLDELRTVRKFQPAAGWVGKVQAVQAGKVMGGNKDA